MPNVARVGDMITATCFKHPVPLAVVGTIASGAGTVFCEKSPVARIGDMVTFSCGHTAMIASGSGTVNAEVLPIARVSDMVTGDGIGMIASGAATVFNTL